MSKPELRTVLELLITEESEQASKLLHEWFITQSRTILEDLMHEDDEVLTSIKDDKDEIESEEFYGDTDLTEEPEDDEVEFETSDDDIDVDVDVENEPESVEDQVVELGNDIQDLRDQGDNFATDIASLRAEFDAIMGGVAADVADDENLDGDDTEQDFEAIEDMAEDFDLDEDEINQLDEAFELEPVADPDLEGDSEIGTGGKVDVSTHSPLPNVPAPDRVGGDFVEIIGDSHEGYERQNSPEVVQVPILKNQVKNMKSDLEPVKTDVKGALLSKKIAADDKGKSPIGGGAVDLRGTDTQRKK